ncbi:HopJ type III effector protein [Pedobacter sp. SD-b]|uniref:HopJ type III effector protein n=1 Tax=Pedobacter segetis TaxID=2793069 RepID=A0ABS1BNJ1_9SPHI|nr:HopJ type III effector protein [Pedobacter segetis]MBK0383769.1 HopJ type III effector protein [Pedobacter segetis]
MKDKIQNLITNLKENKIQFSDVIYFIDENYNHTPTAFKNGEAYNENYQNQGSAKVFCFAQLNNLSKENTLTLFAEHYQAVLNTSEDNDHQNIRQFMANGWDGVKFEDVALTAK